MRREIRPDAHIFWGKFQKEGPKSLPLKVHCLDVALTFRALARLPGFRRALEATADRELKDQDLDRLSVLAMLHDVGKANLGFQMKVLDPKTQGAGHVRELEAIFSDDELLGRFTTALQWDRVSRWFEEETAADSYFLASWSHHGRPICFQNKTTGRFFLAKNRWWCPMGPWDPMQEVSEIMKRAEELFPVAFKEGGQGLPSNPSFHHRFAGLVMLADWLGSHAGWFPIESGSLQDRLKQDLELLPMLLESVGLGVSRLRSELADRPGSFQSRFGFFPRPLQHIVEILNTDEETARLVIAESETGSGKTEASFHWFCRLFEAGKVDGLYFALPTRVAAREIYHRIDDYVKKLFPDPSKRPVTVLAVPGYPRVDGLAPENILPEEGARWIDEGDQRKRERQWAAERPKRFLAATVAVGTVDQALLSSVQTAHAHLRSVCLDRSLLVVDEVHASDAYMDRLLSFLISHHLAVGGWALLLSATLGSRARSLFLEAAGVSLGQPGIQEAQALPYPSVTLSNGHCLAASKIEKNDRIIVFETLPQASQPENAIPVLLKALEASARVLVVMNTVDRANSFLRAVEQDSRIRHFWLFSCCGIVCPHHGRFAPVDRELLDLTVTERLGKNSPPGPMLLIGTQTLEQSLDIDADLMLTDLCPADVLLQRTGRLHRHRRKHPAGYEEARCLVLVPEHESLEKSLDESGVAQGPSLRQGYGSVYEDMRILELTLRVLRKRPVIKIPHDNRWLVEQTTHPDRLAGLAGEKWSLHAQKLEGQKIMHELSAISAAAVYDQYFGQFAFNEAGDRVVTRLGADSLRLPLTHRVTSPFGGRLEEIVIPGHMKPVHPEDRVLVEAENPDEIRLRNADRRYTYTRYGLEEKK